MEFTATPAQIAQIRIIAAGDEWPTGWERWSNERLVKQAIRYYGMDWMDHEAMMESYEASLEF